MTGYPPRRPFRPVSFCFGILTGLGVAIVAAGIIWLWQLDLSKSHRTIAVSWSEARAGGQLIYEAVVAASAKSGSDYIVTAKIYIGADDYSMDVGTLGTARTIEEALQKFGIIRWTRDTVTFGSETVVATSVKREELEKHR